MTKEKEILDKLNKYKQYLIIKKGIPERNIVGLFLYGSQNYGTDTVVSDIDCKAIVIPSFEELCLSNRFISKEIDINGEKIDIKDIRLYNKMLLKQNINYMETLFTDYYILNSKYKVFFESYFLKYKEKIARADEGRTVLAAGAQALKLLEKGVELRTPKDIYNGFRLYIFIKHYIDNKPYKECITPNEKEKDFLLKIRNGAPVEEREITNLKKKIKQLMLENRDTESFWQEESTNIVNKGVIEILKQSFRFMQEEGVDTRQEFLDRLTLNETKAYYHIIEKIKDEGIVSLKKLTEEYPISRSVYNNLMTKIKAAGVAITVNAGVKGMFIKITQPELKAEAISYNIEESLN